MSTVEMVSEETATPASALKPKRKYTRRTPLTSVKKAPVKKAPVEKAPVRKNTSHAGHNHPATSVARDKCRREAAVASVDPFDTVKNTMPKDAMPDGVSGPFPEVPYKLQAEQLRGALSSTQGALNEMRRSFEDANSIVQDQRMTITQLENSARFSERKEVEANKRAERAEKHVTTLLDFLAVAVTFEQIIVPPKEL